LELSYEIITGHYSVLKYRYFIEFFQGVFFQAKHVFMTLHRCLMIINCNWCANKSFRKINSETYLPNN